MQAVAQAGLARWLDEPAVEVSKDIPDFTVLPASETQLLGNIERLGPLLTANAKVESSAAQVDVARAEAGTLALRRDLAVVDAAGRLALVYAEAEAAERRFQLAEEALSVTLADARAALTLVEEGREPMVRSLQGESEAATARASRSSSVPVTLSTAFWKSS